MKNRNRNIITSFSYPTDKIGIMENAEEDARSRGMSMSEYILYLLEAAQKNLKSHENPIGVDFSGFHQEPLDHYLNNNIISIDQWREIAKKETDVNKVRRLEGLASTMKKAYNNQIYFIENGRHIIQIKERPVEFRDLNDK